MDARFEIESVGGNGRVCLAFVQEERPEGGIVEVVVWLARGKLCRDANLEGGYERGEEHTDGSDIRLQ